MIARLALGCALVLAPQAGAALEPVLPTTARQLTERASPLDSYQLPLGVWSEGGIPAETVEGRVTRRSWRIDGGAITTLQVLSPLRAQIDEEGYDVVFECEDRACGGFDFRFSTEVIPAPDMHVDMRDYRFVSARRAEGDALSLLVSRSRNATYIQLIEVTPPDATGGVIPAARAPGQAQDAGDAQDVVEILLERGHVVLADLDFETGADTLGPGPHESLSGLADYLSRAPGQRIALVGHTDTTGGLDGNISLSKRRAEAVRRRLIETYGADPAQVDAEGMGYLAPIASNLTEEGRTVNRRVEAILLSGD